MQISKLLACILCFVLLINPALALQYQQLDNMNTFSSNIPDFKPRAWHIQASQQKQFIAQLRAKGYDVIPATHREAANFLHADLSHTAKPVQLAANFNLQKVFVDECSHKTTYCYKEECNQYPKLQRKDCPKAATDEETEPTSRTPRVETSVSISHRSSFQMPRISGGGDDAAAVMLVVIGVVVIAALFIYAGKWVIDQFSNEEDYYSYWWDIGTHVIYLDTASSERGSFSGLKLSGGFVPNLHTNFGITFELGSMDLNLLYNRETNPQRIQIQGSYLMLGPQVRWLFGSIDATENTINNSYIYLELLGGTSDRDEVDKMAIARIGLNTGIHEHLRIGLHYGAFYLGLDKDQGFANDGDNYWNMYGFELGYQF